MIVEGLLPLPANVTPQLLPPQEAVDYLVRRGVNMSASFNWQDVWQEEHALQFTVSRLTRADLLAAVHEQLMRAVELGITIEEFSDTLELRLAEAGWWGTVEQVDPMTGEVVTTRFDAARLKLILDVNVGQAYSAGLWQRIERNKDVLPLVVYRTMRDEKVRATHRAWDGVTLPVDHPFWKTHYPPNGWRCRCSAYGVSESGLEKLRKAGLQVKTEAPDIEWQEYVNKRTGEVMQVPRGIDPGFGYNAGLAAARAANLAALEETRLKTWPAPIADAVRKENA